MPPLRVAIVGAGIGTQHVEGFLALPALFRVAVICDRDPARAAALAACVPGGAETHADYDAALLARDDLDVIDICLPPAQHFAAASQALRAGRHVICEKPLVGSLAQADALAELARATGRVLMPIFQARFGHGLARARHLFATGAAGRVFLSTVETHWARGPDYYATAWRGTRAHELGGAFLGHAIHIHDMLTTLLGQVASVSAATATRVNPIETEDCGAAVLQMADGSIATLSVTLGSADQHSRLRLMCENVTITNRTAAASPDVYASAGEPWSFLPRPPRDQAWLDAALAGAPRGLEGYPAQFADFHTALAAGIEPPVTLAQARASLELVTAIYRAAREGRRIDLPIGPGDAGYDGWN